MELDRLPVGGSREQNRPSREEKWANLGMNMSVGAIYNAFLWFWDISQSVSVLENKDE